MQLHTLQKMYLISLFCQQHANIHFLRIWVSPVPCYQFSILHMKKPVKIQICLKLHITEVFKQNISIHIDEQIEKNLKMKD